MLKKSSDKLIAGSVLLTGILLTGCSSSGYYYDRKTDYIAAREHPPVVLPDQAASDRVRQVMPLPQINGQEALDEVFVAPRPETIPVVMEDLPLVALQRYTGSARIEPRLWLSFSESPAVVWPLLQQRLSRLGWRVLYADPSTGRLRFIPDTQRPSVPVDAVLRRGIRGGFSDLELVAGERVQADAVAESVLQQLAAEPDTLRSSTQSVSLLAQNIERQQQVTLQANAGDDPVLKIDTEFQRTWIGLELLLRDQFDNSEQKLLSVDPEQGVFNVAFVPEESRSSILTRWISRPDADHHYELVVNHQSPVEVRVRQKGQPVTPKAARQVLTALRKLLN